MGRACQFPPGASRDTVHLGSYVHVIALHSRHAGVRGQLRAGHGGAAELGPAGASRCMRGMFFSPMVLSMTAAGVLWTFVLDYRLGPAELGAARRSGSTTGRSPGSASPATALIVHHARVGLEVCRLLHGDLLRGAAAHPAEHLRGGDAGRRQRDRSSSSPSPCRCCSQNMLTCVLLAVTGGFAGFDLFFTMTNGRPVRRHRSAGDLDHQAGVRPEPDWLWHGADGDPDAWS